jgi:SpoIIAA-like
MAGLVPGIHERRQPSSPRSMDARHKAGHDLKRRVFMIELIDDLPRNVVGIAVKGRVTQQECRDILAPAIARSLRWRDKSRLYYELASRFPGSGWDDLELGFGHGWACERIAIVSDIAWVRLTVKAIRFLIPGEVRVFDTIEAAEARAWITAKPGSRAGIEAADAIGITTRRPRRAKAPRRREPVPSVTTRRPAEQPDRSYAGLKE